MGAGAYAATPGRRRLEAKRRMLGAALRDLSETGGGNAGSGRGRRDCRG